jgi:hypothetical protein
VPALHRRLERRGAPEQEVLAVAHVAMDEPEFVPDFAETLRFRNDCEALGVGGLH